jgi:penicillin-binding protein 2
LKVNEEFAGKRAYLIGVNEMEKRSFSFYIAFLMAFIGLLFRCFFLSSGGYSQKAKAAVSGREGEVVLYRTKGLIYDEQLRPLAGGQPCYYLLINPREFSEENTNVLIGAADADEEEIKELLRKETPFSLRATAMPPKMKGVEVYEGVQRYGCVARHLIGYLDRAGEAGVAGIEKEFNSYLNLFSSKTTVRYQRDAVNGAISGLGMQKKNENATQNGVVLTLNKDLCVALEDSMSRHIERGAAVIIDCESGEIKAACSVPDYEESKIQEYLNSDNGELINRVLRAQTVGSVFKIVVAACALEAGMEDYKYRCEGGIIVGNRTFACHNHAGHQTIGLEEAFTQSCNAYFIALGQMLGYNRISEMAKRFGYGENIELLGAIQGAKGNYPKNEGSLALANLSIGQGALTASPLQIAQMTAIIANGGVLTPLSLYKGLYLDRKFRAEDTMMEPTRVLSDENAKKILWYCIQTVESGTGQNAKPTVGGAGGKTASAQTGIIHDGVEQLNVYFTGFYPADQPRYVITVFAEGGKSGSETCAPVFKEMCDFIVQNNLTATETMIY